MAQQNNSGLFRKDEIQLTTAECFSLQALLAGRIRNTEAFLEVLGRFTVISKLRYQKSKLRDVMQNSRVVQFPTNEVIYQRIGKERSFYLLLHGTATAWGYEHAGLRGTDQTFIRHLRANSYFGHTLELQNMEISTIRASQPCYLLQLDLKTMYKVFEGVIQFPETTQKYNFYRRLLLFKDLDKKRILRMVEATQKRIFLIDNIIYQERSQPTHLFVVVSGQVELLKRNGHLEIPVATVTTYELLGIQDILAGRRYSFTARAKDQAVVIVQIPKEVVLEVLDQVSISTQVFEVKAELRQNRISSAIESKLPGGRGQRATDNLRASFRDKQRFYTEQAIETAGAGKESPSLQRVRKTSYLTNKRQKFFENEAQFYQDRIRQCQTIIKERYGEEFGNKFYNLFEDYPRGGRTRPHRTRLQTAKPMNLSRVGTTVQRRSRQSNKTTPSWQFRSFSSHHNYQSTEIPATNVLQLKRRLLDVEDTEKRLTSQYGQLL